MPPPTGMPNPTRTSAGLTAALAVGLGAGVATSYLQARLPGSLNTLANSGAVWSVVAAVTAALAVRGRAAHVVAGPACLLGEVLGYYAIACPIRGIATSTAERALAAVLVAAGTAHRPASRAAALAAAVGTAVLTFLAYGVVG